MFKKYSLALLTLLLVFTFTACTEKEDEVDDEAYVLNTDGTDALALDFSYEDSDFIADGVGEVSLVSCVDGDTAFFTEGNGSFSVRFLGIDTPESTASFEPWGKAASVFTCEKLTNATTIVLRADPTEGRLDNYGTRYLSWVWYDGRLLNLELVELAYSKAKGTSDNYYGDLIFQKSIEVQTSNLRVWGEIDPDYDYSREGVQITIEELVTNFSEYEGKKVAITGIVTSVLGAAAYIQQGDYGIYVYNRTWSPHLAVGNEVELSGLTPTYYPDTTGAKQCSGYQARTGYSNVLSTGNVVEPTIVTIADITDNHVGTYLKLEDLTVVSVYIKDDAFTITAEDSLGNEISVRKDSDSPDDITSSMFQVGTTFTIVGPLSRYYSEYQIIVTDIDDITID